MVVEELSDTLESRGEWIIFPALVSDVFDTLDTKENLTHGLARSRVTNTWPTSNNHCVTIFYFAVIALGRLFVIYHDNYIHWIRYGSVWETVKFLITSLPLFISLKK